MSFPYSNCSFAETRSQLDHVSYITLLAADDGLNEHLHNATHLINQLLSHSTLKVYHTAWIAYCRFLASYPGSATGDIKHVLALVSFCHTHIWLCPTTPSGCTLPASMNFCPCRTPESLPHSQHTRSQSHPKWHPEASTSTQ